MRLFAAILLLLSVVSARAFQPQDIDTENGNFFFRDTCGWHGYDCTHLPPSRDGTVTWCKNCLDGSSPAACGGSGCVVDHEHGIWRCVGSGGGGGGCLPCAIDADCDDGNPCTTDTCNAGVCVNILTIAPCSGTDVAVGIDGNACAMLCTPCGCGATTTTTITTTTTSTTTTSTTTTTTTTTTTSTTTTTTLGPSVTFLFVPTDPGNGIAQSSPGSPNVLVCDTWVPDTGITSVDRLSFEVLGSSGSPHEGVAIYNFDGSSRITSTGGVAIVGGVNAVTGLSFTLVAGTKYQVCHCSDTTGVGLSVMVAPSDVSGATAAIANGFLTAGSSTAANACAAGSPPLTTGARSADVHTGIIELLLSTTTP